MTMESTSSAAGSRSYPVAIDVDYPERLSRLLIFVKWLLAIPHYVVLMLYGIACWFAAIPAFLMILFTGAMPGGLWDFILGYDRWSPRAWA